MSFCSEKDRGFALYPKRKGASQRDTPFLNDAEHGKNINPSSPHSSPLRGEEKTSSILWEYTQGDGLG